MNTLLSASKSIEPTFRFVYGEVSRICASLGVEFLVVGAAARDLLWHHVYGAPLTRGSEDVDFGLLVPDWRTFAAVRDALVAGGFSPTNRQNRVISPKGIRTDIVPFGPLADENADIHWPPAGETEMSVLGFPEALEHSQSIRIPGEPPLDIRVATPEGFALLKLIAWQERPHDIRGKDAKDLLFTFSNYEKIPEVTDTIYLDPKLGDRHSWDTQTMASELLGRRCREIARPDTARVVTSLAGNSDRVDILIQDMADWKEHAIERSRVLLAGFFAGFGADIRACQW